MHISVKTIAYFKKFYQFIYRFFFLVLNIWKVKLQFNPYNLPLEYVNIFEYSTVPIMKHLKFLKRGGGGFIQV